MSLTVSLSEYVHQVATPSIRWRNLTFVRDDKLILRPQSGQVCGGELVALIGPSGAGKSTLLSCLSGRLSSDKSAVNEIGNTASKVVQRNIVRNYANLTLKAKPAVFASNIQCLTITENGMTGTVTIARPHWPQRHTSKVAFVPQFDSLYHQFTVRETFVFASRLNNSSKTDHTVKANDVIDELHLSTCANQYISKLSGGQRKRVAIGVEYISEPEFLLLDEPTTGLDSSTSFDIVTLLRSLTQRSNTAIICSIHQPSNAVFTTFSRVYLISHNGKKLYDGGPNDVLDYFASFDIICPKKRNLSEFAIDVARGKYGGEQVIDRISEAAAGRALEPIPEGQTETLLSDVLAAGQKRPISWTMQAIVTAGRALQYSSTRTLNLAARLTFGILLALATALLFESPAIGEEDGCSQLNISSEASIAEIRHIIVAKIERVLSYSCMYIFGCVLNVIMIAQLVTSLTFIPEFSVIKNEIANKWYCKSAWFAARTVTDIVPLIIMIVPPYFLGYYFTNQPIDQVWRAVPFLTAFILSAMIGESFGILCALLSLEFESSLMVIGQINALIIGPGTFFCGLFVRQSKLPWFFKPLSALSYVRYAFENMAIAFYGFGKCPDVPANAEQKNDLFSMLVEVNSPARSMEHLLHYGARNMTYYADMMGIDYDALNSTLSGAAKYFSEFTGSSESAPKATGSWKSTSLILNQYELEDGYYYYNLVVMVAFCIILKWLSYRLFRRKVVQF